MVDLPPRVRFGGNLFGPAPEDPALVPLAPRLLAAFVAAAWRELLAGRLIGHLRLFLMGARVGMIQANRRAVRDAIAATPNRRICILGHGRRARPAVPRRARWSGRAAAPVRPLRGPRTWRISAVPPVPLRPRRPRARDLRRRRRYLAEHLPEPRYSKTRRSSAGSACSAPSDGRPSRRGASERLVVSCSAVSEIKRVGLLLDALRRRARARPRLTRAMGALR